AMPNEFIASGKLVFGNVGNNVRRGTGVDHFRFRPGIVFAFCLMIPGNSGNGFRSLLTAARHRALSIGADLHVITRPEIVFSFTVTTFIDRFHHQLVELRIQRAHCDPILWSLWPSDTWTNRPEIEIEHDTVIALASTRD